MSVEMWNSEEEYPVLQEIIRSFTKTLEVLPKVFVGLTKAVVPVLTKVNEKLRVFGEYLDNADPKQLELIGKAILGLAVAGPALIVVGKLTSALGGLFSAISSVVGFLPSISGALGAVASVGFAPILAIVGAVVGVFVFLREEWDKVVSTFTGWVEKTGILQSFQNLKDGLQSIWEKLGGLKDFFYVWGAGITAYLLPIIAGVTGAFNGLVKALSGVMKMIGGVIDFLSGVGEVLLEIFTFDSEKILSGFSTLWKGIKDIFIGAVEGIWNLVSGYFEGVWGFISSLLDSIGITEWLNSTWNNIVTWLGDVWNGISEWFINLWNGVQNFFTTIGNYILFGFQLIGSIISSAFQIITLPFMFIWENCKEYVFDTFNAISEFLSNVWNSILNFLIPILQNISSFFINTWGEIKNTITGVLNDIWGFISNVFNNIWNFITNIFNNILSTATNIWNNIKNTVSNAINNVWSIVQNNFNNIKNFISNIWNGVKSTTTSIWNSIKNAITEPIQNAFNTVKSWIDKIKGLFNFSWSLPKLKLPHFKVSGEFSLNPPKVPSFGIDWYKKGAVLNDPTIFGLNPFSGNLMVGGEAGAEAIAPIDTLQDYVKQAVNESDNNSAMYSIISGIFEVLKEYLPNISKQKLVLDTGAIVGELSPYIDNNLGNINALKVRGN